MIAKGQLINDRYEILKLIGEGGMANVYLARDTILDRRVAVKVLRGDLAGDEKFVRRFQREALSASSLSHPNIVEIYDVGEDDGNFYIVMEYIEGKTLKQLIKKRGVLSLPETMDIMLQLLDALKSAHDSYIIHRDIKPQNIMIKDSGLVKITDFGIAMALNSAQLTQTNSVMGSVHYLPPEQASGKGSTIRSDIYSLGILMFEMLTGRVPFRGDSAVEIALKHMKEPLPSVRELNPVVPQSVENIILKAAAKNPKNRYHDVREMADDIKTCLDEDRENEERITFKYPETDFSDTRANTLKETKKSAKEEPEIKQITEDEKIERGNKKRLAILFSIIGVLAAAFILIIIVFPKLSSSKDIEVPDVSGMEISKAEKMLKKEGFKVDSKKKASDDVDENLVIETDPAKNRYAKKGTTIIIYYSSGTSKTKVEDYTGQNAYEVKAKLELLGIKVTIEEKEVEEKLKQNMMIIPNIIDPSVPIGKDDSQNVEIEKFGEPFVPDFEIPYHTEIMEAFDGIDLESAGRVAGNGFYYLMGDIARIHSSVLAYARDFMINRGFTYCVPPFMIRSNVVTGVMSFAEMDSMMYKIEGEDLYLIGTSEHSMIGKFIDTMLEEKQLPQTLTSYSPCFRKEKGAHGIEERGVYRIHQFEKQEMIVVCKPEESKIWYDKLWQNTVDLFRSLDIPVRTLECCSGDLADLKVKSCDVEAWSPRQKKYFEVGSCSNLGDAQARRLRIRIKGENGNYFAHTLNNTVVAPPRMLIAFLENNLREDGSVAIPEVLRPYMGGKESLQPKK